MSGARSIPVHVDSTALACRSGIGAGVRALLHEVAALLDNLTKRGESGAIDLASLPLAPRERAQLQRTLGEGELRIELRTLGVSEIRDTSIPGVWWVRHRDAGNTLTVELLEVNRVPGILAAGREELTAAGDMLRQRIAAYDGGMP